MWNGKANRALKIIRYQKRFPANNVNTYILRLTSGINIEIHAHGMRETNELYSFFYFQSIAKVPIRIVSTIEVGDYPNKVEKSHYSNFDTGSYKKVSHYCAQVSDSQFVQVICARFDCEHDDNKHESNIVFMSGDIKFMTIFNVLKIGLKLFIEP